MPNYSQANRPLRVDTALGTDVLLLSGFSGEEGVSRPFSFTVDLLSEDSKIDPGKVLRTPATLTIEATGGKERHIHGLFRSFVQLGQTEGRELTAYRAEVVPWLWFLSLSSECRIFQKMSVLEIVEKVFKDQGYSDFKVKCAKSYPKREFCVQYRETHLNFVSRLLEEEGIFYFFEHSKSKHVLVLADGTNAVKPCPVQSTVRMATQSGAWQEEDVITSFEREHAAFVGKVTLRDYNYLKPSLQLESSVSGKGREEIYDFPGAYPELEEGERLARLQLEEQEAWHEVVRGEGTCRTLASGYRFDLKEHYRRDANQAYQLLSVHHSARAGDYSTWNEAPFEYGVDFVAIPHKVPFHPPRMTPKPVVEGSQTALVVGKAGEEIWVDKHGRVKVQFYWDREGKKDENSSCWIRFTTTWAGKNWGFIQIPRIGQEVIVDFLEGDPDQPIITGSVYNAEQVPPYDLPANQTQSGVKSRSSKGGGTGNFNEIRMEDKKGSEELHIHAERKLSTVVEAGETRSVGGDRATTIGKDEKVEVKGLRETVIHKDENINVKNHRTVHIDNGHETIVIHTGNHTLDVNTGHHTINVKTGNQELNVNAGHSTLNVKTGNRDVNVSAGAYQLQANQVKIQATSDLTLQCGAGKININAAGIITIQGTMVKIN